jgi:ribosomal protein L11 methyltransferase
VAGPRAADGSADGSETGELIDVVINPGLGFGTGLHPTTRGTLGLLQEGLSPASGDMAPPASAVLGPLTDVGTGSGILAIAAAKLGWAPVIALDNDPVALISARENVAVNGVEAQVEIHEADTGSAQEAWFDRATVLANMTLEPVSLLLRRLATLAARPRRLVVSGILAGSQEEQVYLVAHEAGFVPGRRVYEGEWVSFELLPDRTES